MAVEKVGLHAVISGMGAFKAASGEIDRTFGRLGAGSEKAAGRLSKLGDIARTAIGFAVGTVAVSAVKALSRSMLDLIVSAAPLRDMERAFERLTETYDLSAKAMIENMRAAAKGTISDAKLIESANLALVGSGEELGKEFGKALPKLLEMARASAKATGEDVDFLFESLVRGIKRTSPMIIDNTGLQLKLGEAQERYAKALGITVEEMTAEQKQIALLNATLEAGAGMTKAMGEETLTTAEKMAKLRATMENWRNELGKKLLPILDRTLDILLHWAEVLETVLVPRLAEGAKTIGQLRDALKAWRDIGPEALMVDFGDVLERVFGPEGARRLENWAFALDSLTSGFAWLRKGDTEKALLSFGRALDTALGPERSAQIRAVGEAFDVIFDPSRTEQWETTIEVGGRLATALEAIGLASWQMQLGAQAAVEEVELLNWQFENFGQLAAPTLDKVKTKVEEFWQTVQEKMPQINQIVLLSGMIIGVAILGSILGPLGLAIVVMKLLYTAWTKDWGGIQAKTTEAIDTIKTKLGEWQTKWNEWYPQFSTDLGDLRENIIGPSEIG